MRTETEAVATQRCLSISALIKFIAAWTASDWHTVTLCVCVTFAVGSEIATEISRLGGLHVHDAMHATILQWLEYMSSCD